MASGKLDHTGMIIMHKPYLAVVVLLWCFAEIVGCAGSVDSKSCGSLRGDAGVELEQNLWEPILQRKPAAWIWGGDAIYGDTHRWCRETSLASRHSREIAASTPRKKPTRATNGCLKRGFLSWGRGTTTTSA